MPSMGAKPAGGEGEVWSGGFVGVEVEECMAATVKKRRRTDQDQQSEIKTWKTDWGQRQISDK